MAASHSQCFRLAACGSGVGDGGPSVEWVVWVDVMTAPGTAA